MLAPDISPHNWGIVFDISFIVSGITLDSELVLLLFNLTSLLLPSEFFHENVLCVAGCCCCNIMMKMLQKCDALCVS